MNAVRSDTSTYTRLTGRWLNIGRGIWIVLVLLIAGLFIAAIPARIGQLNTTCVGEECARHQASPEGAQVLEELGFSLSAFAIVSVAMDISMVLVFVCSAVVIFVRRSDDWMAMFVSLALVSFGIGFVAAIEALATVHPVLSLLVNLVSGLGFGSLGMLFYLFPNGRFVPRWTRWLAIAWAVLALILPFTPFYLGTPSIVLLVVFISSGLFAQVYRYRRVSGPVERQQTKWVLFGFAMFFGGMIFGILPLFLFPSVINPITTPIVTRADFIARIPWFFFFGFIPFFCLPVSIAISTLRYRLWDVDPIINRSLVYGGLTLFLGLVFAGGFFGLRTILEAVLGSDQIAVAAAVSAAVIVALFTPARRRLRRFVDRRFYGIEIEYQTPPAPGRRGVVGELTRTHLGDYVGLEPIGSGGMAEVYRAQHPTLNRTVAVKILPQRLAQEGEFRRRFEREAQVVARLKHPNIVQMHDFGEAEGMIYMVMEYVEGQDLAELIRATGRVPLEQVRAIVGDIAAALDYAHQQGLVHRDIKPSNVMLEPVTVGGGERAYRAVLMDFGIARIVTGATRLTRTGMVGTLDYVAPEQIQAASEVDGRADVYSLGVMTYQMVTGKLPFAHSNPGALLMAHLMQPPPDPRRSVPELPLEVAEGIVQAMAKKPDGRYATAGEMATALG